ncbi:MAG TPA: hypothetical protein VHE81_18195 [Lacipirellulaceae bacterium]|nr:hypothetical protein [Lacipirellulaceae bacterium]
MTNRRIRRVLALAVVLPVAAAVAYAGSDFLPEPSWKPVKPEAVFTRLEDYLQLADIAPAVQAEVRDRWRASGTEVGSDLLTRLAQSLAKADDRVAELVAFCAGTSLPGQKLPEFAWLADSETPEFVRYNMRLYYARWLVQQGYNDEAISWTEGLSTDDVVAPEELLFYRAVAYHQLVEPDKSDVAIGELLEGQDKLPARYQKLAELMRHDMEGLKDGSLDHISRRMADIRRRLAQGRSGERVQSIEKGVIDSLDKLIKKAEDQAQLQQAQMAAGSAKTPPSTPMQDSHLAEGKGPGKVEQRDIGHGTGWGNLPDKDREKAMQEIGREYPSHYREVIEEYFRRLAAEESADHP